MIYPAAEIVKDVRTVLDNNNLSEALLADEDIDTLCLNEIIKSKIESAAEIVELAAPAELLENGHNFGEAIYWGKYGSGWILLPGDFMRLITFRMSDWERTVDKTISSSDPEYKKQSSRYKGIRGNIQKPVCAIASRPEGKVLEFYSCKNNDAYVSQAIYLPYPRIDEAGGVDICERCHAAVIYMAAALTLITLGENEKAASMTEVSKRMLQQ